MSSTAPATAKRAEWLVVIERLLHARLMRDRVHITSLRWVFYPQFTLQVHGVAWAARGHVAGRDWDRDSKPGHSKRKPESSLLSSLLLADVTHISALS